IPNFSALENVLLGREGGRLWLRPERHCKDVEAVAARFGLALDLDTEVRQLAVGVQQKVEILKSAYRGVDILILDEPTTMLTPQEVDTLFGTLRAMADQGLTVVFITHKIREILTNCDRVTVMRGGRRDATVASVGTRIAAGLVVIPEDRIADGLLPGLSVAENLVLGLHPFAFTRRFIFDRERARELTRDAIAEYAIRARSEDARAVELSGGNIQKLLVARAMAQARAVGGRL